MESQGLSIQELGQRAQVPIRTVRYYISEGLLPAAAGRGRTAVYTGDHLLRLNLIRRLAARGVPLSDIRSQLAGLGAVDLQRMLADEQRRSALEEAARARSPRDYVSALLARARGEDGAEPAGWAAVAPPQEPPAGAGRGETWRRIALAPGVELHVSAAAERKQREMVARLIEAARRGMERGGAGNERQ